MRLAFKVWCETRARLAVAVAALALACAGVGGGDTPETVYLILATVLGGGTPRQERAARTLGFTLALPVSRARHLAVRAAVGLAEIVGLAALAAALAGTPATALRWGVCGAVAFAVALACAALIASEVLAWLVAFAAVMIYEMALALSGAGGAFDLYGVMRGGGTLPWRSLAGLAAAALALLALAATALARQEP